MSWLALLIVKLLWFDYFICINRIIDFFTMIVSMYPSFKIVLKHIFIILLGKNYLDRVLNVTYSLGILSRPFYLNVREIKEDIIHVLK